MRKDSDRIADILDAIEDIVRYSSDGREKFDEDELVRVWCLRHIEVIGEASAHISEDLKIRYPSVPWREIVGMRNNLIHGYFQVDWIEVWNVVEFDLSKLKTELKKIQEAESWEE